MLQRIKIVLCVLILVSISSPAQNADNIQPVGSLYNFWSEIISICAEEDFAYFATGNSGLQILDILNPLEPEFVSSFQSTEKVYDVAVQGEMAFLACGDSGLVIVSLRNLHSPEKLSQFSEPERAMQVLVHGETVIIRDVQHGIYFVDISDPLRPEQLSFYGSERYILDMAVSGDVLYFCQSNGMYALDISNHEDPVLIGSYAPAYRDYDGLAINIDLVVLYSDRWVEIVDMSEPQNPRELSRFPAQIVQKVDASQNILYLYNMFSILIYDILQPAHPQHLGSFEIPYRNQGGAIYEDLVIIPNEKGGCNFIDVTDLENPELISEYDAKGYLDFVHVVNNITYLHDSEYGYRVVSLEDPIHPVEIGSLGFVESIVDLYTERFFGFVATYDRIKIYDFLHPNNFGLVTSIQPAQRNITAITYHRDRIYIASDGDLVVYDWPEQNELQEIGVYTKNENDKRIKDVEVRGDIAYIVGDRFFETLDISNLPDITLTDSLELLQYTHEDLVVEDGNVFISRNTRQGQFECLILDVSNPEQIEQLSQIIVPWRINDLAVEDTLVYFAEEYDCIRLFNISNLGEPVEIAYHHTTDNIREFAVIDGYIYTAESNRFGVYHLEMPDVVEDQSGTRHLTPTSFSLSAYPNPFNSSTTIEYRVGANSNSLVTLSLYDLQGRLVQTLVEGRLTPGNYRTTLNANNLASGVYVVRLDPPHPPLERGEYSRKVVVVK